MVKLLVHDCSAVYQDESSDELSEALDDLLLPASDTEDIWQQDDDDLDNGDESEEDDEDNDDDDEEQVEQVRIVFIDVCNGSTCLEVLLSNRRLLSHSKE